MNTDSIALWKTKIKNSKRSGQTVKEWCQENNVTKSAYYYWHRKIRNEEIPKGNLSIFEEVQPQKGIVPSKYNTPSELIISWKKFSIKITDQEAIPMVAELLKQLESLC